MIRIPDKEEFIEKLWNIYPSGDFTMTYELLKSILEKLDEEDSLNPFTNKKWTFEDIVFAFKEYNEWWDITYQDREDKYIKKEEGKMNISRFLQLGKFQNRFKIRKNTRDVLLFGNKSIEELRIELNNFLKKLNLNE
jgi:hypothetical protein